MVDLSKLKEGDTVKFRCGGEAVISKVSSNCYDGFYTWFVEYPQLNGTTFRTDGSFVSQPSNTPFDIIEIISAPFNWSEVKPGDAFDHNGRTVWYIGPDYTDKDCVVLGTDDEILMSDGFILEEKNDLTRTPEHDIEVPS